MIGRKRGIDGPSPASLELLPLALSRPKEALARARALLAEDPGPEDASIAHQAAGIVLRDFGDVDSAIRELRMAVRLARAAEHRDREADALATLGNALVLAGHTRSGLAALDTAARQATGVLAGRVRMRRGGMLMVLGRYQEALEDLRPALATLRRAGDTLWEARALTHRAFVHLALGSVDRAEGDIARSEELFAAAGQELELAFARHNRGLIAFRSGDLPAALAYLDEAAQRYEALGATTPDLSIDRCAVLLAAGLPREALQEADGAIHALDEIRGQPTKRAELLLSAASSALDAQRPAVAIERAQAAYRLFDAQRRAWWREHARLLLLEARYAAGAHSGRLPRQAEETAARLEALGAVEAPRAHLLAGRAALALARPEEADRGFAAAARLRGRGPALTRATGWLAEALRAAAAGDSRRTFRACRRGLEILDEHLLSLGASELRAQATAHGAELAALAQRQALRSSRPRELLAWSERWRAAVLTAPAVHPPDDPELRADLAAVRSVGGRLQRARVERAPTAALQREQQRLERAIRARVMRIRSGGVAGTRGFDVASLLDELGEDRLVQIVDVDGELHVLVCGAGRVRRFPAGRAELASREVELARFRLRTVTRRRAPVPAEVTVRLLEMVGRRLEEALLGQARRHLGDGPVTVVPTGRLHGVPWPLLPCLRDRVVSVAPSASVWLRARRTAPPRRRNVVLVLGPGLETSGAEVPALARRYDDVTVLGEGTATAEGVLAAIDGVWLAHIAAHGSFRADSPLFSFLRVDDGPLTVHDLEGLRRAPYRLVLASCESALLAPVGADELLGLATSLVRLGTVGIIASVVPVGDAAATGLMLALHGQLGRGATLAESLQHARRSVRDDPAGLAAGWSFLALGAG